MKKQPIPYTCEICGAELNDLKQIIRPSSRNRPKMSFRCLICEHTFDVVGDHCMHIFRETLKSERILKINNKTKIPAEILSYTTSMEVKI